MSEHQPDVLTQRASSETAKDNGSTNRYKSHKRRNKGKTTFDKDDFFNIASVKDESPSEPEEEKQEAGSFLRSRRDSRPNIAARSYSVPSGGFQWIDDDDDEEEDENDNGPQEEASGIQQEDLSTSAFPSTNQLNIFQPQPSEDTEGVPSIMGMPSILGSLPEMQPSGATSTAASKPKNMRLIVRRAYRNPVTQRLYAYDEGRRLIIVPTSIPMDDLRQECARVVKTEAMEVLINEHGDVRAIEDTRFLCNLDEVIAVTEAPPPMYECGVCHKLITSLNLGHPDHKPLDETDGAYRATLVSRSASHLAVMVQRLNSTKPLQEQGSVEMRRMSRGWGKVAGKVFDKNRPFFVYSWRSSLAVDLRIMMWMIGLPLAMGVGLACIPFEPDILQKGPHEHKLYAYIGMTAMGLATGLFINAWIGFYFFIHMSPMSYILAAVAMPPLAVGLYFGLSRVMFPFYNTPICVMLILTAVVYIMAYPHMPRRLRMKKQLKKDLGNSMVIMDFLVLVFVVNRLLVLNFGQRDALSLLVLSVMYPLLVTRSTVDCARLAEAFNRKTVTVVEAFFTFVSSIFQMIVFLAIDAKVRPILVFLIINITDIGCLLFSGPLVAFFKKRNRMLLQKHQQGGEDDSFGEALDVFLRWVKDPLKLKPLLVKCYCECSAKFSFILLSLLIRFGPSKTAYPFIHDVSEYMFNEAIYFTTIEMVVWLAIQYAVEYYLRVKRCQYMLHKEKKNMLSNALILGFNNGFITVLLLLQQTPVAGA